MAPVRTWVYLIDKVNILKPLVDWLGVNVGVKPKVSDTITPVIAIDAMIVETQTKVNAYVYPSDTAAGWHTDFVVPAGEQWEVLSVRLWEVSEAGSGAPYDTRTSSWRIVDKSGNTVYEYSYTATENYSVSGLSEVYMSEGWSFQYYQVRVYVAGGPGDAVTFSSLLLTKVTPMMA